MNPINADKLEDMLIRHEGLRLKPYKDTVGKMTIGVGRNLDDVGITAPEAIIMLNADIAAATSALINNLPWFSHLDEMRQAVLIDMCFNMGWPRLSGFKRTLAAVSSQQWDIAADEMLDSLWAKQVGDRAIELSEMMRSGKWQTGKASSQV